MITVRKSAHRGQAQFGWLHSQHTFSFGEYIDKRYMGFGTLRVINEDRIAGGTGFDTHPHHDMEIISYVLSGGLEHRDSMGNSTVIKPGDVQLMSAGTGVRHSEHNHLKDQETHFLQMWVIPDKQGLEPSYGQKNFSEALKKQNIVLAVSPDGVQGSIPIHQDVRLYLARLQPHDSVMLPLTTSRRGWVQIIQGSVSWSGGNSAAEGDGLALTEQNGLSLSTQDGAHFLYFDLP